MKYNIKNMDHATVVSEIETDHINGEIAALLENFDYVEVGFNSGIYTKISLVKENENGKE